MENLVHSDQMESPMGRLYLAASEQGLTAVDFRPDADALKRAAANNPPANSVAILKEARRQLGEYFAGTRRDFDLPLAPRGTPFQHAVWEVLAAIPYGETISYGALARRLGRPRAARAVGAANGKNPLAIILPCHRVIGSDGRLTGYAGGLAIKEQLLALEAGRL